MYRARDKSEGWDALSENLSSLYSRSLEPALDNRCEISVIRTKKRCIESLSLDSKNLWSAFGNEHRVLELSDVAAIGVTQRRIDLCEPDRDQFLD